MFRLAKPKILIDNNYAFYEKIPSSAKQIMNGLINKGFETYIVGGACRNYFANHNIKDWDIVTNAAPQDIANLLQDQSLAKTVDLIKNVFGGCKAICADDNIYEIVTFRSEDNYNNNRHPSKIKYEKYVKKDLFRRDFTINTILYDIEKRHFIDYFDGAEDIRKRIIRCIGSPYKRLIKEDPLRILRAIRFSLQLDFEIERNTLKIIQKNINRLLILSNERINDELKKCIQCNGSKFGNFIDICNLTRLKNIIQLSKENIAILKKIDKINFLIEPSEKITILDYMSNTKCFDNGRKRANDYFDLVSIMKYHSSIEKMTNSYGINTFIKFLMGIIKNEENVELGVLLYYGFGFMSYENLIKFMIEINKIVNNDECRYVAQLQINGYDLSELGFKSEQIKDILNQLLRSVITHEIPNKREVLLEKLKSIISFK